VHPCTGTEKRVNGQRHVLAALYPRERPGTHCTGGLGGPQGRSGQVTKISSPPGFDPRTVQPVASVYIDYAARPKTLLFIFVYVYVSSLCLVAQWLRYCATNRKVAGSIPDGVIGIFHCHNLSDRTMALGSTQPLTEMSTRSISWRSRWPVRKDDNLNTILCRCHVIWEP
jgi:hypothetical protein